MLNSPAWAKDIADGPITRGCHVVLLGTDSLSMLIGKRSFLEGRYREIRTTNIAVIDERDPHCGRVSLFEIKHSSKNDSHFTKHLKNPDAIAQVFEAFGYVVSRTVVYMGKTERRAVLWVNAEEFLKAVSDNPEDVLFPQCSERWSPQCESEPWMQEFANYTVQKNDDSEVLDPHLIFSNSFYH